MHHPADVPELLRQGGEGSAQGDRAGVRDRRTVHDHLEQREGGGSRVRLHDRARAQPYEDAVRANGEAVPGRAHEHETRDGGGGRHPGKRARRR